MISSISTVLRNARIRTEANRAYRDLLGAEDSTLRDIGVSRDDVRRALAGRPR
jgi:uncharacterized protein YjiS (DUF1127 family)